MIGSVTRALLVGWCASVGLMGCTTPKVGALDNGATQDTVSTSEVPLADSADPPEVNGPQASDADLPPEGDSDCAAHCAGVFDETNGNYCGPDTALRAYWPEVADCITACSALPEGDPLQTLRFIGCVYGSNCAAVESCETPLVEDSPACVSSCDAIFELCGQLGGIVDVEQCAPLCTGIFSHYASLHPEAAACISAKESCGASPSEESFTIMSECLPKASEACVSACQAIVQCSAEGEGPTQEDCEANCSLGGLGDAEAVSACIAESTSCDEVWPCVGS